MSHHGQPREFCGANCPICAPAAAPCPMPAALCWATLAQTAAGLEGGQGPRGSGEWSQSMNLLKRLETLEAVLGKGQDPNYRILDLISRLSDPGARAELEEIVATRRGSQGMREVAAVLLFGQAQIAELDSAEGTQVLQ